MKRILRKLLVLSLCFLSIGGIFIAEISRKTTTVSAPAGEHSERILIIDAGHGGTDGGAVSYSGMLESTVNLDIAQKCEKLCHLLGINTVMTRNSDEIAYPKEADTLRKKKVFDQKSRLETINSVTDGILLSIHQNYYESPEAHGAEMYYNGFPTSESFACCLEASLTEAIGEENCRKSSKISDSIFLMKNASCPAVLAECSFLSNKSDEELLKNENYRIVLASSLVCGYIRYIEMIAPNESGGYE